MVHYVRLLKIPRLEVTRHKAKVRALVTVTTDLGDEFLQADLSLFANVLSDEDVLLPWKPVLWKSHMRVLPVELEEIAVSVSASRLTFIVSTRPDVQPDEIIVNRTSHVMSLRSDVQKPQGPTFSGKIQRSCQTGIGDLHIYEEVGDSIARHLW